MDFVPICKILTRHELVCSFRNIGLFCQDLLIEVLCCLPPKSLMRCCCVCKAWYLLIRQYCVPRITPSLPFLGCHIRIKPSPTNLLIGRAAVPQAGTDIDAWPPVFNIHDPTDGFSGDISPAAKHLLDSQDGLMLFQHPSENKYVLWNQNTKQFLFIPCPPNHGRFVVLAVDIKHWKPDKEMDFIKIVSFPRDKRILDVFSSHNATWVERKIKYIRKLIIRQRADPDDIYILDRRFVYLHGKIFKLFHMKYLGLIWYTIGDGNVDVVCDHVQLPGVYCTGTMNGSRIGCIGSCGDRIQYVQNDETVGRVNIWVLNVDARRWTLMHSVKLKVFVMNRRLVKLRTMFPAASNKKFKPLAFDPVSDDGVIIWTPNLVFCYYFKSRKLVPLRCSNVLNDELEHPPDDAFAFTQCLAPLVFARPN